MCALLFALTFRALLPTGYMLETHGDGIELVLCGSGGLQTIVVDANGRPGDTPAHTDKGKTDAVCAFASVAAVAPADDLAVVASRPPWSARPAAMPASIPRDWRNPRGPPPPLRGPPFSMI